MTDIPKKPTSTKVVYQNPWITIREDTTVTSSGQTGIYAYMESRDSVMVAPVNGEDEIFLVKAFRYPTKAWGWELPGGGGDGEELIGASRRELEEETGIRVENIEKLGETLVCNGLMTEKQTTCVAWNLSFDGQREQSDEVFADQRFFSIEEIENMIKTGEINDNQTITGLYLTIRWIKENHG
jgi:8-oxo-dGTP pyrophosphatase MutT (NUDIX family)